jgi:hypothetical protein
MGVCLIEVPYTVGDEYQAANRAYNGRDQLSTLQSQPLLLEFPLLGVHRWTHAPLQVPLKRSTG